MRKVLAPADAPKAIGPYSVGIQTGGFVFCSGTIGVDPETGKFVEGGIEAETRQVLINLGKTLAEGTSSFEQVVKTTVFMTNMEDFPKMNAVYAEFFGDEPPARSTIEVSALPGGAMVEIEAIAVVKQ
jgi:2-iminobutanoate/2-iminopropanoate deaminase